MPIVKALLPLYAEATLLVANGNNIGFRYALGLAFGAEAPATEQEVLHAAMANSALRATTPQLVIRWCFTMGEGSTWRGLDLLLILLSRRKVGGRWAYVLGTLAVAMSEDGMMMPYLSLSKQTTSGRSAVRSPTS